MIKIKKIIFVLFTFFVTINIVNAQTDSTLNFSCENHLPFPYVSDGQQYVTLITKEQSAEFKVTFYEGTTYRIVACCGESDGNLIFSLYDRDKNQLFSGSNFDNTPFWDFKFETTMECTIEAKLRQESELDSGFAIILIGFKQ